MSRKQKHRRNNSQSHRYTKMSRRVHQRKYLRHETLEDRLVLTVVSGTSFDPAGGIVIGGSTQVTVTFDEDVLGADLVGNYELRGAGGDGLFNTGDDNLVAFTADYGNKTAKLSFAPLALDDYRLTVKDTITDTSGMALDGDNNGTAGGDYVKQFQAVAILPAGPEFQVNTYTLGDQETENINPQSVAMASDGSFVVTWSSNGQDGSDWGVYAQRYDAAGNKLGGEFQVNTTTADLQRYSKVAMDAAGNFVIAWESLNQDGSSYGVYARRYDAAGNALGNEFQVNSTTFDDQGFVNLAIHDSGILIVTWSSYDQDGDDYGIFGRAYDATGNALTGEVQINTTTVDRQYRASIDFDAFGNFVVVWSSRNQDGDGYGIFGQRFDAFGNKIGGEFQVNSTSAGNQLYSDVAVDDSGNFVAVWSSFGQDGSSYGIYGQRFDASGSMVGSEFLINNFTANNQIFPSVDIDSVGNFIVTWSSQLQDGSGYGVYARGYDIAGNSFGGEFRINSTTAGDQRDATVATDGKGNLVVVWSSFNQDGSGYGVFGQRYGVDRTPPTVVDVVNAGNEVKLLFSELVSSTGVTNPNNWSIVNQDTRSAIDIDNITFGYDSESGLYAATLAFATLDNGTYALTLTDDIRDLGGNRLDGDQDGNSGGDYIGSFTQFPITRIGTEFQVNTFTYGNQETAEYAPGSVAIDSSGNYVVVWMSDGQDGSGRGVYAQRYDAAGNALGGEFRVNTTTYHDQGWAKVAMDASGNFVVTWDSFGQDGSSWGVFGQRFDSAGNAVGSEFRINTTTFDRQLDSNVEMDAAGNFIVTWSSFNQDGDNYGVYGQGYDAAGNPIGGEFRINSTTTDRQWNASVAVSGVGTFVVTWSSRNQDGSGYGIYGQLFSYGGPIGGEFQVNSTTLSDQRFSNVAMDAAGNFVVTWSSLLQDGDGYGIFGQRYDSAGNALGGEFQINTTSSSDQTYSTIDMDSAGHFVVTWSSLYQDGDGYGVFGRHFDANGHALGGEFQINTTTAYDQRNSSIAMNDNGEIIVVWESRFQDGSGYGVFGQRYRLGVTPVVYLGSEFQVNTYTNDDQFTVEYAPGSVAIDSSGNFVVVWTSEGQDGSGEGVYAQRFDADGNPIGGEFQVNTTTIDDQGYAKVAVDAAGNFVVTWDSFDLDGSEFNVYGRRYDAAGNALGGEFRINTTTFDDQLDSNVDMDAAGNFVVTWSSRNQDGDNYGVYAQGFDAAGNPLGSEFRINSTTTDRQWNASVAVSGVGTFVVTWSSRNQDGSGYGIYGQLFSYGGPIGGEFQVNSTTLLDQRYSNVAMDAAGNFIVAWSSIDIDGSVYNVYGQRYDASGNAVGSEFRINTTKSDLQIYPTVDMDAAGSFIVTWTSIGQDGSAAGVFGQRYDVNGVAIGGEFQVNTYTDNDQGFSSIAANDQGRFVVVWSSVGQDGSGSGVYGQRFAMGTRPTVRVDHQVLTADEGEIISNSGSFHDFDVSDDVTITSSIGAITQTPGNAGAWNWSYQTTDGPVESQTVTITATDSRGVESSLSFDLEVNNVAPTATIQVPTHVLKNETKTYTFSAEDVSAVDAAAGFTYHIDWDGDGSFDQTLTGGATVYVEHVFTTAGDVTIFATATDKDGGTSDIASQTLSIIQPVEIDVRSEVNLNSSGVIAVSLYTTDDFDAATVDTSSVVFANALAIQSALEDLDGDGDLDLVLHFRTEDTDLEEIYAQLLLDDANADGVLDSTNQETEAFLTGTTYDDVLIEGSDSLDLFLRGRALRELLDELFAEPAI